MEIMAEKDYFIKLLGTLLLDSYFYEFKYVDQGTPERYRQLLLNLHLKNVFNNNTKAWYYLK